MHVCLFDIDGTLLSSGGAGKAAMEMALITEFGVTAADHRVPFSGRTDRAIGRDLLQPVLHVAAAVDLVEFLADVRVGQEGDAVRVGFGGVTERGA